MIRRRLTSKGIIAGALDDGGKVLKCPCVALSVASKGKGMRTHPRLMHSHNTTLTAVVCAHDNDLDV